MLLAPEVPKPQSAGSWGSATGKRSPQWDGSSPGCGMRSGFVAPLLALFCLLAPTKADPGQNEPLLWGSFGSQNVKINVFFFASLLPVEGKGEKQMMFLVFNSMIHHIIHILAFI